MLKLQSVKSEIRYTPNMILVKLVGSHSISQILLRISEIKRTKMVSSGHYFGWWALFRVVGSIWSKCAGIQEELVSLMLCPLPIPPLQDQSDAPFTVPRPTCSDWGVVLSKGTPRVAYYPAVVFEEICDLWG